MRFWREDSPFRMKYYNLIKIVTALIQNELRNTSCITKGWVLVNYPFSTAQQNQFLKLKHHPGRIIYAEELHDKSKEYLSKCQINIESGRLFTEESKKLDRTYDLALENDHHLEEPTDPQKDTIQLGTFCSLRHKPLWEHSHRAAETVDTYY